MITVNLICIGKLKEKFWRDACGEYAKRLTPFCKFNIIEIDEERLPDNPSQAQIQAGLHAEGSRILSKIGKNSYVVALCIEGEAVSSEKLSKQIEDISLSGKSSIDFIIGGSFGISDNVKASANYRMSMSRMTFPHQLARVMLCEQIYRAFQLSNGGKYHK